MIQRAEDGKLYLQASGPVYVDQKLQTRARIAVGQVIAIGPYTFHVEDLSDTGDAAELTLIYGQPDAASSALACGPSQGVRSTTWAR